MNGRHAALALSLAAAALGLVPAAAPAATPGYCEAKKIQDILVARGKLTRTGIRQGTVVNSVRCRDFTGDGFKDVLFAVASGGTAGNTQWGIMLGRSATRPGRLAKYVSRDYHVTTSFLGRYPELGHPIYEDDDPNCCPSAFTVTRYRWTGRTFVVATTKRVARLPARFRP